MDEKTASQRIEIGHNEAMALAMENMGVAVGLLRLDGTPLFLNRPFLALHGPAAQWSAALGFDDLIRLDILSTWNTDPVEHFRTLVERLRQNGGVCRFQLDIDNHIIAVEDRLIEDRMILSVQQDITEQIAAARKLAYLASHDNLTGLANRASAEIQLDQLISAKASAKTQEGAGQDGGAAERNGPALTRTGEGRFALLIGDLDLFKEINDTHGHAAGDAVLRELAGRFRAVLGDNGFAARLGGDEFLFVCNDDEAPGLSAERLAQRLIACTERPVLFEGKRLFVGLSLGYSLFPDHGTQTAQLTRAADIALYRAKSLGRGMLVPFARTQAA